MRFKGLDLNLLITLGVLLEEKSVSAAAAKLNVTQPAISAALKKLREYFNDELLVANGKQMLLSSHARQIVPELTILLENLDVFVSRATHFTPESTSRQFTLAANDYFCSVVLAPMLSKLVNLAPYAKIQIIALNKNVNDDIRNGTIDLAFSPDQTLADDLNSEALYREELAILACESNARFKGNFGVKDIAEAAHVLVDLIGSQRATMVQRKLHTLGLKLNPSINLPSFLVAPELIQNTNLVTITHRSLALKISKALPLYTAEMPSEIRSLTEFDYCVFGHPARHDDPGLRWLISMIKQQVASL